MEPATLSALPGWANFYVIAGSSAGALTGLQFVVMTLIAGGRSSGSIREIRAFGTPTVVHFCVALLVSCIMTAPWRAFPGIGMCLSASSAAGIWYALRTIWHARKTSYKPDMEDWIWYAILPLALYAALFICAILLWVRAAEILLYPMAGTAVCFLLTGIRNSWDTVTYIAIQRAEPKKSE